jgi:hypothetical protein
MKDGSAYHQYAQLLVAGYLSLYIYDRILDKRDIPHVCCDVPYIHAWIICGERKESTMSISMLRRLSNDVIISLQNEVVRM